MTLYLDTSVLVSLLTNEPLAQTIQHWLSTQQTENFAVSDWVTAEFSAALSIKRGMLRISQTEQLKILSAFERLCASSFSRLPITARQFLEAAHFANRSETGLRASDALHLAICAAHDATFCTLDRQLHESGPVLGIKTELI